MWVIMENLFLTMSYSRKKCFQATYSIFSFNIINILGFFLFEKYNLHTEVYSSATMSFGLSFLDGWALSLIIKNKQEFQSTVVGNVRGFEQNINN